MIAVDVGYGLLDYGLREDPRVQVLERTNARALEPSALPAPLAGLDEPPTLAVVDVSFISLAKVLGAVLSCLAPRYDVLALVKPQFEVGRERRRQGRSRARPRRAPRRAGRPWERRRSPSAPLCSATAPRACRARRATRRRSSGSPRARGSGALREPAGLEELAREVEP